MCKFDLKCLNLIEYISIKITPSTTVKIILSNTNMKPNEFINIIHNQNIDFIKTDNIDGLNGIQ